MKLLDSTVQAGASGFLLPTVKSQAVNPSVQLFALVHAQSAFVVHTRIGVLLQVGSVPPGFNPPEQVVAFILAAVREFANKSAASAASPDSVKFQAVIKSAASAASLRGGRASGRLDHGFFLQFLAALAAKK